MTGPRRARPACRRHPRQQHLSRQDDVDVVEIICLGRQRFGQIEHRDIARPHGARPARGRAPIPACDIELDKQPCTAPARKDDGVADKALPLRPGSTEQHRADLEGAQRGREALVDRPHRFGIESLYKIEDEIGGAPPDARRRARLERAAPVTEALRIALDEALLRLSPKSEVAKAIAYGRKRWTALTRFVNDGCLEIDNNIAERAMRSIAIGRKNWLFAGSKACGERAAAIDTVIETCKLNSVEPQAYIADVIAKIAGDWPASRWDEVMPWNWRRANEQPIAEAA